MVEKKKIVYKDLIESLHKENLLLFVLGSLISADSNYDEKSIEANKKYLKEILTELEKMNGTDETTVPKEEVEKYIEKAKECIKILEPETDGRYTDFDSILYLKALSFARKCHEGQKDKGGNDYIGHPIRVADRCSSTTGMIVALLHDVIEDCDVTADDLLAEGFPKEVVEAVEFLTRTDVETYDGYIRRLSKNKLARDVKLADLEDNMNVRRLNRELNERDLSLLNRYIRAYKFLKEVKDED
jgi:hypothetical protein